MGLDGAWAYRSPPLRVSRSPGEAGTVRLAVAGEVDMANVDQLREAMAEVLREPGVRRLVVDLAGVGFLDSTGIAALAAAHRAAAAGGPAGPTGFVVVNCQPRVLRVLEITGVDKLLTGGS